MINNYYEISHSRSRMINDKLNYKNLTDALIAVRELGRKTGIRALFSVNIDSSGGMAC